MIPTKNQEDERMKGELIRTWRLLCDLGVAQKKRFSFLGSQNKAYSILGSILGSPYLGKLPFGGIQGLLSGSNLPFPSNVPCIP